MMLIYTLNDFTNKVYHNNKTTRVGQNKLTQTELDNIKQPIEIELNVQNNQTDNVAEDVVVEANNPKEETFNEDEVEPSQNPSEIEDLVKEIKRVRAEYNNIRMEESCRLH